MKKKFFKQICALAMATIMTVGMARTAYAELVTEDANYVGAEPPVVADGTDNWASGATGKTFSIDENGVTVIWHNDGFTRNADLWSNFIIETVATANADGLTLRADNHGWTYPAVENTPINTPTLVKTPSENYMANITTTTDDGVLMLNAKKTDENTVVFKIHAVNDTLTYTATYSEGVPNDLSFQVGADGGKVTLMYASYGEEAYTNWLAKYPELRFSAIDAKDMAVGQDCTAKVEYTLDDVDLTADSVTYTSANTSIATVAADGTVTGVAEGDTTITVTATIGLTSHTDTINVTVAPANLITSISATADKSTLYIKDKDVANITVDYTYENEEESAIKTDSETVTWTSSDPNVATVENGVVTPLREGKVTITATAGKNQKKSTVEIDVKASKGFETELDSSGWWANHSTGVEVTTDGIEIEFTNISYDSVANLYNAAIYVVYNGDVPLVNGIGYSEIMLMRADTFGVWAGDWTNKTTNVADFLKNAGITYTVLSTESNTIEDLKAGVSGKLRAVIVGEKLIVEFTVGKGTSLMEMPIDTSKTTYISLSADTARLTNIKKNNVVMMSELTATVDKTTLNRGETAQITATVAPSTTTWQPVITYSSSNDKVVTVDKNGKVTAVGAGEAKVTVTATSIEGKKTAAVDLKVIVKAEGIEIKESMSMVKETETKLDVTLTPSKDEITEAYTIEYSSSNEDVATVDKDGNISALVAGEAKITVTLKVAGETVDTAECVLRVVNEAVPMTSITVDKSEVELYPASEAVKVKVTVNPAENTDNPTITYATSNDKVATVKDGVITPVGVGEATITVTATAGENVKTATVKVKVLEPVVEPEVQAPDNVDVKLNEDEVEENLQLTEEEKAAVNAGAKATLEVAVVDSTKTVEAADKTKIEAALKTLTKVVLGKDVKYFDIDVTKVVGNNETALTTLKKAITITVTIPDEWILADNSGRTYKVVRIHDGKAEFLDGTFDAKTKTFAFSTDKFSTYALTYVDAEGQEPTTQTGGNSNQTDSQPGGDTAPVMMLLAIAAVAGAAVVASKKKNVTE